MNHCVATDRDDSANDGKLHISDLKRMAASAQHYQYAVKHEFEQTPAMRFGSLVHAIILGGHYTVYDGERRGKAWTAFRELHCDDRLIVTASEVERATVAAVAIRANLSEIDGGPELLDGRKEYQIDWVYRGRPARSTLDVMRPGLVVDLKITSAAGPTRFPWHAQRMLYHAQMAFYCEAADYDWRRENRIDASVPSSWRAAIIAAEDKPPHAVCVYPLTAGTLQKGAQCCVAWAEKLDVCERSGRWPGYAQSPIDWDIPDEVEIDFGDSDGSDE
jgi:hypothetical protein